MPIHFHLNLNTNTERVKALIETKKKRATFTNGPGVR